MGISRMFEYTDPGAPVLTATLGSFINVIQKVLVDGYGTKAGLGWTRMFTGTNKAVYKNKGTETFVQFLHDTAVNRLSIRGHESMSDIDNGVLHCPPYPAITTNSVYFKVGVTNPSYVCPWRIIGDDKGIWIITRPYWAEYNGPSQMTCMGWQCFYVGDYIPFDLTNTKHNFCVMRAYSPYGVNFDDWPVNSYKLTTASNVFYIRRDSNFEPGSVLAGVGSGSSYEVSHLGNTPDISYYNSLIQMTSIPVIHTTRGLMGRLPGFKNSLSQAGNRGVIPVSYGDAVNVKNEMVFDCGDYKEIFMPMLYNPSSNLSLTYKVFTVGKGFRDAF